jgi:hypothetical protein
MLICAILSWGKDLLIQPVESYQYVKNLKNRLRLDDVDFIVYDSGFYTPIDFDNGTGQKGEDEIIELFGKQTRRKRKPAWDVE